MEDIRKKINYLKAGFKKKENKNIAIKTAIFSAIGKLIGDENTSKYFNDYHLNGSRLILETKNKTCANELFFKKEQLLSELSKTGLITEITIR